MVRNVPAQLKSLLTFTYTRAAQDAAGARHSGRTKQPIPTGQRTKHKSVAWYQGDKDYVRRITENMIDPARWADEVAPDGWPLGLQYPQDVLKFAPYGDLIAEESPNTEKKPKKGGQHRVQITSSGKNAKLARGAKGNLIHEESVDFANARLCPGEIETISNGNRLTSICNVRMMLEVLVLTLSQNLVNTKSLVSMYVSPIPVQ